MLCPVKKFFDAERLAAAILGEVRPQEACTPYENYSSVDVHRALFGSRQNSEWTEASHAGPERWKVPAQACWIPTPA
jgi:hypothetical protein